MDKLKKIMPGLALLTDYRKEWLSKDITAGLSVASIALPIGIAYASLAGMPPEAGLYSTILPMALYALFGSSRQLIIGPDSATCVMVAAAVGAYATAGTPEFRGLSGVFCVVVGALAVLAGIFKLGFVTNFMSKPILTGYLNGLGLSIIAGQLGKLFGFSLDTEGLIRMLIQFFSKLDQTSMLTLVIGVSAFIILRIFKAYVPRLPAPLIIVILCSAASIYLGFTDAGIKVVGDVPSGFPSLGLSMISFKNLEGLIPQSLQILLVTYCSMMLTNKSFASKRGYRINSNQEFVALGVSNIASGLSQGFVVSGADSRTAVNDSFGGKTQLVSLVAAAVIALVVMFLTKYIEVLPVTVLASIVISATLGLFNLRYLTHLKKASKAEYAICIFTSLCVLSVGVIPALFIAVLLSMIRLVSLSFKPATEVLGLSRSTNTFHNVETNESAVTFPGLLIFRFNSSLLFYNSEYFEDSLLDRVTAYGEGLKTVLIDGSTFLLIDVTGGDVFKSAIESIRAKGFTVMIAASKSSTRKSIEVAGITELIGEENLVYTLQDGVKRYQEVSM